MYRQSHPAFEDLSWPPFDKEAFNRRLLGVTVLSEPMLPKGWSNWVYDTARAQSTPPDFVASNLLATAAGAIGNTRTVAVKASWTEPSVFWFANVQLSALGKTPAQMPFTKALAEAARNARQQWKRELAQARQDYERSATEAKAAGQPAPKFEPPPRPRLVVIDTTSQQLCRLMDNNPHGLIGRYSELGIWYGSFDRYSGNGVDRAFFLLCYDALPYIFDRVGSEKDKNKGGEHAELDFTAFSVMGDITPDKLKLIIDSADDGFVPRFIFIWPEPLPVTRMSLEPDENFLIRQRQLVAMIERLHALLFEMDDRRDPRPKGVRLSKEALALFIDTKFKIDTEVERLKGLHRGWLGKSAGRLLRLALVFEYLAWAAETPETDMLGDRQEITPEPKEVGLESLERALTYLRYLTGMFRRVIAGVEPTGTDDDADIVLKLILRKGLKAFSIHDLYKGEDGFRWLRGEVRDRDRRDRDRRDNVINLLISYGILQVFSAPSPRGLIDKLAVHPHLAEILAA